MIKLLIIKIFILFIALIFNGLNLIFQQLMKSIRFFYCCHQINPICNIQLYFLIHPDFIKSENLELFKCYENVENLNVFYLKDKGWKDDWKAGNLNFDEFFLQV
jgi:hypothetical protein